MSLPHELLDEILGYLSLDDKQDQQSLRNYSLVAKSWTNPSRRHLFKTVEIGEATLQSWLDTIPPANVELLQHVRSLSYLVTTIARQRGWRPMRHIDVLRDYLPSFHQLQHLSLSLMHIPSDIFRRVEMFSAFQHTLSRLSLKHCDVTISALVTLINCFSNLDRLDLSQLLYYVDDELASSLSRPLIRELHASGFHEDHLGILDQLSELEPAFEELDLEILLLALSGAADFLGVKAKRIRLSQCDRFCMYTHESPP